MSIEHLDLHLRTPRDGHFEILGFGLWISKNLGFGLDFLDLSKNPNPRIDDKSLNRCKI